MLSKNTFISLFIDEIHHSPTESQKNAISLITDFLYETSPKQLFILKGYAGTGKTTIISALVRTFAKLNKKTILLAPTGRAAKVFATYAGTNAYTIHKILYRITQKNDRFSLIRKCNTLEKTLFIVDEASMINNSAFSDSDFDNNTDILSDLIDFTFEGMGNKLLFIGDDAQLPPVNSEESPALSLNNLSANYSLNISTFQLTDVVRQAANSGILNNATRLRQYIQNNIFDLPIFYNNDFPDFIRISSMDLEDTLNDIYCHQDPEDVVIITRSNKRANIFNREIRARVFYRDNQISAGDYLMIVKNNYFWIEENSPVGFLANGELIEVLAIRKVEELYGFHFADISVRLCDYPNFPTLEIKIILESLDTDNAALSYNDRMSLYQNIAKDYEDIPSLSQRKKEIRKNPYLNAVQTKFAYALTCHKTQGGQWKNTFIDLNYFSEEQLNKDTFRWLYTALTRSTEKTYLINFNDRFFD